MRKLYGCANQNLVVSSKQFDCFITNKKFCRAIKIFMLGILFCATKQFCRLNKLILYNYGGIAFCTEVSKEI